VLDRRLTPSVGQNRRVQQRRQRKLERRKLTVGKPDADPLENSRRGHNPITADVDGGKEFCQESDESGDHIRTGARTCVLAQRADETSDKSRDVPPVPIGRVGTAQLSCQRP
jgi:hypothetical protein